MAGICCEGDGTGPGEQYGRCLLGIGVELGREVSRQFSGDGGGGVREVLDTGWWRTSADML